MYALLADEHRSVVLDGLLVVALFMTLAALRGRSCDALLVSGDVG